MSPVLDVRNEAQALAVLRRLEIEKERMRNLTWGSPNFPEQFEFIHSNAPLGAALCTRRAGKSWAVGEKLYKKAHEYPASTVLYTALTRESARSIMWVDILKAIAEQKGISITPNEARLELKIKSNNSIIKLFGADADKREREKVLGNKYPYIAVDESGSFAYDLESFVYEYLEPCVIDYNGCIDLIGTPTVYWQGFFSKVTRGKEPGWKIFKWNTTQNPFVPDWDKRVAALKERKPGIEDTPFFERMYLGRWVTDEESLVYKFLGGRNTVKVLPDAEISGQALSIDLGFDDDTSYVISRWYEHSEILYFIDVTKKKGQVIDDVIAAIKQYVADFDIKTIVIDNASKQFVESLKRRFRLWDLNIIAATKKDKFHYIEVMNSDFIAGRIKLLRGRTELLVEEYGNLIKDPKSKVPKELESCPNHLADAGLYNWRFARNYMYSEVRKEKTEEEIMIQNELDFLEGRQDDYQESY